MAKLYLIDGTALIYRAYFAFIRNPLRNSKGENTSAIFGVINSFLKLLNDQKPERLMISFDLKEPTFRHEISDSYKANRPPAPDDLISQIEPVKEFFAMLRIPEISIPGYEADDILATLAERYKNEQEIVIVTSDKDFAQLVDERVTLYDPFSEKVIDSDRVKEKYGISTEQFADFLAIMGDSSDNIPGIKGVGAKGAATLLNQFSNLDDVYAHLDEISSDSLRRKVEEGKEDAYLSRKLAKIDTDVPLDLNGEIDPDKLLPDAEFRESRFQETLPLLQRYELNSIISKLRQADLINAGQDIKADIPPGSDNDRTSDQEKREKDSKEPERKPASSSYDDDVQLSFDFYNEVKNPGIEIELIDTKEKLDKFVSEISDKSVIALAVEPSGRRGSYSGNAGERVLTGIAFATGKKKGVYIPLAHSNSFNVNHDDLNALFEQIGPQTTIVGHNLKEDSLNLLEEGISLHEPLFDTMIASYLFQSQLPRHSLIDSARRELHYELKPITDLTGTGRNRSSIKESSPDEAAEFCAEDAAIIYHLYERYKKRLVTDKLEDLFYNIEIPLLLILTEMERTGVYIDCDILKEINRTISGEIEKLTEAIYKQAGKEFNINSTQQLSRILFEEMNIPPVKKTKTGYSTDNSFLEALSEDFEIARLLIDYRQLAKLRSTYIESLPQLINSKTGRIHSSFNQTITSTGRLSSSNPNLQNIPIRTRAGREIRKAFTVDDDDYVILAADYSQIELRILGILSKDRNLITAFNHHQDIHAQTAGLILNKPITTITQDERRMAKAINFGIIYGMGPNKLSKETSISLEQAKEFIKAYFTKFSRVKEYIEQQKSRAKNYGYAETIMGRRLTVPDIHSSNQRLRADAERIAVNMPIQGSAADIIKMAMIRLNKELAVINNDQEKPPVRMIIQVHDELVFEVRRDKLDKVKEIVAREMKNGLPEKYRIVIPLAVDMGSGKNWFEAHS